MLIRLLKWLFKDNNCQHNDDLVNQFEMLSEVDILKQNGITPKTFNNTTRRMISDYKCNKCGRIDRRMAVTA